MGDGREEEVEGGGGFFPGGFPGILDGILSNRRMNSG